jgi:hypothetical protein
MILKKVKGVNPLGGEFELVGETGGVYPKGSGMGIPSSSARSTMSPQVLSSM